MSVHAVVGEGPVGAATADLLAEQGQEARCRNSPPKAVIAAAAEFATTGTRPTSNQWRPNYDNNRL
ncbi:hypothetical protein ACWDKQ_29680 [Saccharopolyspora sp. NPDC000995]